MICNVCDREMYLKVRKNTKQKGYICDECYLIVIKEKFLTLDKGDISKIRRRIEEKIRKNQELIPILAVQLNIQMDELWNQVNKSLPFPECSTGCKSMEFLGVGECESVCPDKFNLEENSLSEECMLTSTKYEY